MAQPTDTNLTELEKQLGQLDAGKMSDQDVHQLVEKVMDTLRRSSFSNRQVFEQLSSLSQSIKTTRNEIAAIRADAISGQHIPDATDQLDEVVGATEDATNKIMDCCDAMTAIAGELPAEANAKVMDQITKIYEACNFQDLTGQRITKVVRTLKHIESQILTLISALEQMGFKFEGGEEKLQLSKATDTEKHLLNGPQAATEAIKQDDIDKLFG
jgi:chemotaxis protein CheZ